MKYLKTILDFIKRKWISIASSIAGILVIISISVGKVDVSVGAAALITFTEGIKKIKELVNNKKSLKNE